MHTKHDYGKKNFLNLDQRISHSNNYCLYIKTKIQFIYTTERVG